MHTMMMAESASTGQPARLVCEEFALVETESGGEQSNSADRHKHTGHEHGRPAVVFGSARVVYRQQQLLRPACADPTALRMIDGTPYPGFLSKKLLQAAKQRVNALGSCTCDWSPGVNE